MSEATFSVEQMMSIYHKDYIEYALLPLVKSEVFEVKFISIQYLFPCIRYEGTDKGLWEQNQNNLFLKDYRNEKEKFAKVLLKDGMYFPLYVSPIDGTDNYYVYEGRHRIDSLRMLMSNGELSPDYKVLCVVSPPYLPKVKDVYIESVLSKPAIYRFLLKDSVFRRLRARSYDDVDCLIINRYTVQYVAKNALELIDATLNYQDYISHYIYYYPEIKPSKFVNNESEFNKITGRLTIDE